MADIEAAEVAAGGDIVVDFEGVEAMSPSFADELFAKLSSDTIDSGRVRFERLDENLLILAQYVIAGRESSSPL